MLPSEGRQDAKPLNLYTMANHCNNSIYFYGKDLGKIKEMIADAIRANDELREGWLPESTKSDPSLSHYLFDVCISSIIEGEELAVDCWTKWSPPLEELVIICKEANVSCLCLYDELGSSLFGQFEYDVQEDVQKDIFLDEADFDRVQYDEESDLYAFNGEVEDSDFTCYMKMLDEKINSFNYPPKIYTA